MARNYFDPGGAPGPPSYYSKVKTTLSKHKKLDRKMLEIFIEKNNKDVFIQLSGDEVARVCALVGINMEVRQRDTRLVTVGRPSPSQCGPSLL